MYEKSEQLKALYREYRPDTFEAVIGQGATISALQRVLINKKIAHAYLFSGPRGCGKTTCARIFARCLNCAEGPTPTPCGKCPSCIELKTGGSSSVDVIEMDAASHNGVDDARELRERVEYAPSRDRYKIVILDEAHMITTNAFNALLKIVEEPPEHVKFIFATTEPEKLIGTIRSRTYHYPFRLVPSAVMMSYAKEISKKENIELDERIYQLLVKIGGGSVRDTLSFLDQLFASAVDNKVEYDFAVRLLGFTPVEYIHDALYALSRADIKKLFSIAQSLTDHGISTSNFLVELLENVRNSLLILVSSYDAKPALGKIDEQQIKAQATLSGAYGFSTLTNIADVLLGGVNKMKGPASGRLVLELTFAQLAPIFGNIGQVTHSLEQTAEPTAQQSTATPAQTVSEPKQTQQQIQQPENAPNFTETARTAQEPKQQPESAQTSQTAPDRTEPDAAQQQGKTEVAPTKSPNGTTAVSNESVKEKWGEVLEALMTIKKPAAILIKGQGKFLKIDSGVLLVAFENPCFVETFERSQYAGFTSQAAREVFGTSISVRAVATSEKSTTGSNDVLEIKQEPTRIQQKSTEAESAEADDAKEQPSGAEVESAKVDDEEVVSATSISVADDPFSSLKEMLGATEVENTLESAEDV
ncbi:MAG: DNA polymerase III subunit gamma/tau [Candidatus Ancillula trichonymphae]|nr:DNA polymerase III subunit gamma/tau [Candidatus Ancillula trichonymphae]